MMTVTEKAAYLKGLVEMAHFDADTDEVKIISVTLRSASTTIIATMTTAAVTMIVAAAIMTTATILRLSAPLAARQSALMRVFLMKNQFSAPLAARLLSSILTTRTTATTNNHF